LLRIVFACVSLSATSLSGCSASGDSGTACFRLSEASDSLLEPGVVVAQLGQEVIKRYADEILHRALTYERLSQLEN